MAPKKKDKTRSASDWLQCSLCGKLINPSDAEIHGKSCDGDYPFVLGKCLTGRVVKAEDVVDAVTKKVGDKDNYVWLSVSAMTVCEIAIGQYVVVGGHTVKRAWPVVTGGHLTSVGLSKDSLEEMKLKEGSRVTAEKVRCQDKMIESAELKLTESNKMFEMEEFSSFVCSHLDGTFLTKGSPLRIKYFGQICHCQVSDIHLSDSPTPSSNNTKVKSAFLSTLSPCEQSPRNTPNISEATTPQHQNTKKVISESPGIPDLNSDQMETPSNETAADLSTSFSNLSIDKSKSDSFFIASSTPKTQAKCKFPTLSSPIIKSNENQNDSFVSSGSGKISSCEFGKVISGVSRLSIVPMSSKTDGNEEEVGVAESHLEEVGGMAQKVEELSCRIHRAQQPGSLSRCILVHGPPGTGKSLLVKSVVASLGFHTQFVTGTDIWSKLFGQAEANLRNIFKLANDGSPSLIVIDDLDAICPKRSLQATGQQEHRIVGTLLSLVDGASNKTSQDSRVVVIGITNKPDDLDPAVRRSGRFGCEVEIGVPNPRQRTEILKVLLRQVPNSLTQGQMESVAKNAHGYVGADLTALVNEAGIHAMIGQSAKSSSVVLGVEDLVYAGQLIKPSALREIQMEVSEVRWSDIGGMSEVKMRLREAVELPLTQPSLYQNLGIEPPRGLLMYGPPGCSKTMIARAVATECRLNFLAVKGPELFNQYVGESEKAIREIFRKARSAAPSVVFFDEIDAISAKRGSGSAGSGVDDRVLTQLLTEMDGLEYLKDVFIMAATNRPDKMDRALLRPGRFDSLVYVPLPDDQTRREILETKLKKMKISGDVNLDDLVEMTLDYSGAEIIQLCQEAAMTALRENIEASQVVHQHFEMAAMKVLPQTDGELLKIYQKFSKGR